MLPQIIYFTLTILGLIIDLKQHGKQKEGKHNFIKSALANGFILGLLCWGGFFDVFIK